MGAKCSPRRKPPVPTEIRLIGRLIDEPQPEETGVGLRLRVRYGAETCERRVLAVGGGAESARRLRAGDLVYVVGCWVDGDDEHEIHAPHVLARGPARREEPAPL